MSETQNGNGHESRPKAAWRVNQELADYSGLSVAFWRKLIADKGIAVTKAGRATLLLDTDVREYLGRQRGLHEVKPLPDDVKARRNQKRAETKAAKASSLAA